MTPYQIAREWCSCCQTDGSCHGPRNNVLGHPIVCVNRPKCLLALGERCDIFETDVLGNVDIVTAPEIVRELRSGKSAYLQMTNQTLESGRKCPLCENTLQKGKRLCPACAERRRRETYRAAQRKRRGKGDMTANGSEAPTT